MIVPFQTKELNISHIIFKILFMLPLKYFLVLLLTLMTHHIIFYSVLVILALTIPSLEKNIDVTRITLYTALVAMKE